MKPTNSLVNPLLTDLYQFTMAYAYWKNGVHEKQAAFDLFFRKNPFGGEFTVFAGLEEALNFVGRFGFTDDDLAYIKKLLPGCDDDFFLWLRDINCSAVEINALYEGTLAFPRIPLIRVEGPLAVCQLLETTLLNLVNYASLVATNAARFRLAAGPNKVLLEFGLRRAQGPDGGVSASRYSYMGGFDGTSNVLAGKLFGIPVRGTHAHAFVSSFSAADFNVADADAAFTKKKLEEIEFGKTNLGELAAFLAYARAFPDGFLALVDTYDTLRSGIPNFLAVAALLHRTGHKPIGIRLDSGDLAYLSKEARRMFRAASERLNIPEFANLKIAASNDINEETLHALNQQGHEIDIFGIGTHLVTCQAQPALGCVYKLVEIDGEPRIKLSDEPGKITIPGTKKAYRLIGKEGFPLADVLTCADEPEPAIGMSMLCRHPFDESKRMRIQPSQVSPLHRCFWAGNPSGIPLRSLKEIRAQVLRQLATFRPDHLRSLNPTPYRVSVSEELYRFLHDLRDREAPVAHIE